METKNSFTSKNSRKASRLQSSQKRLAFWQHSPLTQKRGRKILFILEGERIKGKKPKRQGKGQVPSAPPARGFKLHLATPLSREVIPVIPLFLNGKHLEEEVVVGSLASYLTKLEDFERYLDGIHRRVSIDRLQVSDIQAYLKHLKKSGRSAGYQKNAKSVLKSFFLFFQTRGMIPGNPAAFLKCKRGKRPEPQPVPLKEVEKMHFRAYALHLKKPKNYLFRLLLAAISTSFGSGLRISELLDLVYSDLTLSPEQDGPKLLVRHGKGGYQRVVPMLDDTVEFIRALSPVPLEERKGPVFLNPSSGKAVSTNTLYRCYHLIQKAANLNKRHRWHALRATFFTTLAANGATIMDIMTLGGHLSAETSRYYIGSLTKEALQSHRELHDGHKMKLAQALTTK